MCPLNFGSSSPNGDGGLYILHLDLATSDRVDLKPKGKICSAGSVEYSRN